MDTKKVCVLRNELEVDTQASIHVNNATQERSEYVTQDPHWLFNSSSNREHLDSSPVQESLLYDTRTHTNETVKENGECMDATHQENAQEKNSKARNEVHVAGNIKKYSGKTKKEKYAKSMPTSAGMDLRNLDFITYQDRKRTFYHADGRPKWPHEIHYINIMAESWMIYKGQFKRGTCIYKDLIECLRCGGTMFGFKPGEDPIEEHRRLHPDCR